MFTTLLPEDVPEINAVPVSFFGGSESVSRNVLYKRQKAFGFRELDPLR